MILSMNSISKIENIDLNMAIKYLSIKSQNDIKIDDKKLKEIIEIKKFIKCSAEKIIGLNIENIAVSIDIFKHEHDAILFFKKDNAYTIIDIEIKINSTKEKIHSQIKSHLSFLSKRLKIKKYGLYGITFIINKNEESVFKVARSKKEGFKIIGKKNNLNALLKEINNQGFSYINDPLSIIKNMESNINQIIAICKEKEIQLTSGEEKLTEWISENINSNDIVVIDANGGVGKTTILFKLFFGELKGKSTILFNNYRIKFQINEEFSRNYKEDFFYKADEVINKKNKEILLIDEAQRLTYIQIKDLKKKFKTLILFGDKYQVFESKYDCDYGNKQKWFDKSDYKCIYKQYKSDTGRRCSRKFLSTIKHILNPSKYEQANKNNGYLEEKIFIYDESKEFIKKFNSIEKNKKMFTQIKYSNQVAQFLDFKENGFTELHGRANPNFAFNNDYQKIGTVYNAFSFEIDFVFVIIIDSRDRIREQQFIFNEIYTLFTRTKKELHILFFNDDIIQFCDTYDILKKGRGENNEKFH